MSIAILAVACFMTWFCHKRRNMLLALGASTLWLGLTMWFFFGGNALLPLGVLANDIIAWFFFIMMWVPLLLQMDVEIKHESSGKSWSKYGQEPSEKGPTAYENYRQILFQKTRRGR